MPILPRSICQRMALPERKAAAAEPRSFLATIASRHGIVVALCLAALSALAWWWLWQGGGATDAMPGMDMAGMDMAGMAMPAPQLDIAYFASAALMWAIMMVAMMLPSAAPMILLHDRFSRKNGFGGAATLAFGLGYLAVWSGFALLAAASQAALTAAGVVEQASITIGNPQIAAALLVLAAIYEISGLKQVCLSQCQSPVMFLTRYWRGGVAGGLSMGLRHGAFCLGCCWVLMLLLFVGGVMNLAWIAALTVVVVGEKYLPPALRADRIIAALLLIAAAVILVRPG